MNPILHQTMPLKKLIRSAPTTEAVYVGELKNASKMKSFINSYAIASGAKLRIENYVSVSARTGDTLSLMSVTVTKRGRALQKPGRKSANTE